MNQKDNELKHYGVLGMKWGKRRARRESTLPKSAVRRRLDETKSTYKNLKSARKERDAAIQDRYAKTVQKLEKNYKYGQNLSAKDMQRELAADNRARKEWEQSAARYKSDKVTAKAAYKEAKQARKEAINKTYKELKKNESLGKKLLFNDATRKRTAQLITDYNMPLSQAKKAANKEAVRNTVLFMTVIGAMNINTIKQMIKK